MKWVAIRFKHKVVRSYFHPKTRKKRRASGSPVLPPQDAQERRASGTPVLPPQDAQERRASGPRYSQALPIHANTRRGWGPKTLVRLRTSG